LTQGLVNGARVGVVDTQWQTAFTATLIDIRYDEHYRCVQVVLLEGDGPTRPHTILPIEHIRSIRVL